MPYNGPYSLSRYDNPAGRGWHTDRRWAYPATVAAVTAAAKNIMQYVRSRSDQITPMNTRKRSRVGAGVPAKRLKFDENTKSAPQTKMPLRRITKARRTTGRKRRTLRRRAATRRARTVRKTRGVSFRRVKAGIKPKASKPGLYGAEQQEDFGGVISNDQAVYVGHTTIIKPQMLNIFAKAVVRKLFRDAKIDFDRWEQFFGEWANVSEEGGLGVANLSIYFTYWNPLPVPGNLGTSPRYIADDTPTALADRLKEGLRLLTRGQGIQIRQFYLVKANVVGAAVPYEILSTMHINRVKVHFNMASDLAIQNLTRASQTVTDSGLINEVGNNPLKGFYYTGYGNNFKEASMSRNTFNPVLGPTSGPNAYEDAIAVDQAGLIGDSLSGLIRRKPGASWADIPPNPATLNAKGNRILVNPGSIKKSKIFSKKSFNINEFLDFCRPDYDNNENFFLAHKYGKCAMFGLDHLLNCAKNNDPNTEALLQIGYELKFKYGCFITNNPNTPVPCFTKSRAAGTLVIPPPPAS